MTVSNTVTGTLSVSNMDDIRYGIYLRSTTVPEKYVEATVSNSIKGTLSVSNMDDIRYGNYSRLTNMTEKDI